MSTSGVRKKLVVLGTGPSITSYPHDLTAIFGRFDILSWGASFEYCANTLNRTPTFFSFIDPKSAIGPCKLIVERKIQTRIIKFSPIVDTTLSVFTQYLSKTSGAARNNYPEYIRILSRACAICGGISVPATTVKKLGVEKNPLYKTDLDDKDARLRFEQDKIICGMKDSLGMSPEKPDSRWMNLYEPKLTMCIFPLIHWLGYKEVYLLGFDCYGGRYFDSQLSHPNMLTATRVSFPRWMEWQKFHKINFYSLMTPNQSLLNQWIEYVPIKSLRMM